MLSDWLGAQPQGRGLAAQNLPLPSWSRGVATVTLLVVVSTVSWSRKHKAG